MIRSCFWEGNADPELLDLAGLSSLLTTERDISRRLVVLINRNLEPHRSSLPEKVTPETVANITWGPGISNALSIETIVTMVAEIKSFKASHFPFLFSIQNEMSALVEHLSALGALIDLSDCSHMRNVYLIDIRENLCDNFINKVHSLSCCFGLLSLSTILLFLLSFCAGHRVLARLERLEYSDYLNRQRQEDEEEQKACSCDSSSIPEQTKEDRITLPSDAEHVTQSLLVEEKNMPVYDQNGQQVLDLVYIPPPIYFYGQPESEPQQQ
jgi:hypothetical protein